MVRPLRPSGLPEGASLDLVRMHPVREKSLGYVSDPLIGRSVVMVV